MTNKLSIKRKDEGYSIKINDVPLEMHIAGIRVEIDGPNLPKVFLTLFVDDIEIDSEAEVLIQKLRHVKRTN